MRRKKRAGGGGQLNRSETVTIRLDPKLNYLADLAGRAQRRTKSSLIEAALAEALNVIRIDPRPSANNPATIAQLSDAIWHVHEPERLRRLAQIAPHLMTFEEQTIWAVLEKNTNFWLGVWADLGPDMEYYSYAKTADQLFMPNVEEHWATIKKVASGELPETALPAPIHIRYKQPVGALNAISAQGSV